MMKTTMDFFCPYGDEKLKRVQSELLEMFTIINEIFKKNQIRFFLAYGSMLGAIRHQGFIPWDDDLDIAVYEEDYEKAVQLLRENLDDKYIVHDKLTDPIYWCSFSKIRLRNSKTTSHIWLNDNKYKYTGISIDIYACKKEKVSIFRKKKNKSKEKALFAVMKFSNQAKLLMKLKALFQTFIPLTIFIFFSILDKISKKEPAYLCDPSDLSAPMHIDSLFPLKETQFEGVNTLIPARPEAILTNLYGDYMAFPPVEKRITHYSSVEFLD